MSVVEKMGEYTPVKAFHAGRDSYVKGMPKLEQQIVIGTPGTIIDLVQKARILDLTAVKVFVLDEADNMLDSGTMGEQSIQVKKWVSNSGRESRNWERIQIV